ncbi:MAG: hypothetical protein AB7S38_09050 [Vulcanimicrobiota bacterium]
MNPLSLERFRQLSQSSRDPRLQQLPFAVEVPDEPGTWLAQRGDDLVVFNQDSGQSYQQGTAKQAGLLGWVGFTQDTVWASDGQQQLAFDPKGRPRPAAYPAPSAIESARRELAQAQQLVQTAQADPLKRAALAVPYGSLQAAKATLEASAPALTGPAASVALAQAMLTEAARFSLADPVATALRPQVVDDLKQADNQVGPLLAPLLEKTSRPAAMLTSLAVLTPTVDAANLQAAAGTPAAHELVPLLFAQLPQEQKSPSLLLLENHALATPQNLVQALQNPEIDPLTLAFSLQRQLPDATARQALLAEATQERCKGLQGPEAEFFTRLSSLAGKLEDRYYLDLLQTSQSLMEQDFLSRLAGAAARVRKADQKKVIEALTEGLDDPLAKAARSLARVPHQGDYCSLGRTLQALCQPDVSLWQAGLQAAHSVRKGEQAQVLATVLELDRANPDANPQLQAMLEAALPLSYPGDYESLAKTLGAMIAGFENQEDAATPAAERALLGGLETLNKGRARTYLEATLPTIERTPKNTAVLQFLTDLSQVQLPGDYESHPKTARTVLAGLYQEGLTGSNLLLKALDTVSSRRAPEVARTGLGMLAAEDFPELVEQLSNQRFPGDYESFTKSYRAALEASKDSSPAHRRVDFLMGACAAASSKSASGLLALVGEACPDSAEARFLAGLGRLRFPGDYESAAKSALAAWRAREQQTGPVALVAMARAAAQACSRKSQPGVVQLAFSELGRMNRPRNAVEALLAPEISDARIATDPMGALDDWQTILARQTVNRSPDVVKDFELDDEHLSVGEHTVAVRGD